MTSTQHVAIIGAGILGASLAWHLAARGAQVTVIDEGRPANRATHGSFGWINARDPDDEAYFRFRVESVRLWRDLHATLPSLPVRFGGTLNWQDAPDRIEAVQRALDAGGHPARLLSRKQIAEVEAHLSAPPEVAIEASAEGVADPARIAEALLFAAMGRGAVLRTNTRVLGLTFAGGRVAGVEIPEGVVEADATMLATGAATADLLAAHGFAMPMENTPGLLIGTAPVARMTARVLTSPTLHVWQKDDGGLLLGEDFGGTDPAEGTEAVTARVMGRLGDLFEGLGDVPVATATVTRRPGPADGYPALGRVPGLDGLWVAVARSGVTLAPVIGASLASEIVTGKMVKAMHPYRIHRFAPKP